jgi:DNA-binding NarL/FixJ family response regulator
VRVLIAEDNALMRQGLVMMFTDAGHTIVGAVSNADELAEVIPSIIDGLDLAVLDIRMPPTRTDEGSRAALALRRQCPGIGILLLSNHIEPHAALRLLRDHPRGFGYLLKDRVLEVDDLLASADRIGEGGSVVDPEVVSRLLRHQSEPDPLRELTRRELEVLALIAEGLSNVAVATRLRITLKTTEHHVAGIFTKLGLTSPADDHRRVRAVLAYLAHRSAVNPQ